MFERAERGNHAILLHPILNPGPSAGPLVSEGEREEFSELARAAGEYVREVKDGSFPAAEHSFES